MESTILGSHADMDTVTSRGVASMMEPAIGGLVGFAMTATVERSCAEGSLDLVKKYGYAGGLFGQSVEVKSDGLLLLGQRDRRYRGWCCRHELG